MNILALFLQRILKVLLGRTLNHKACKGPGENLGSFCHLAFRKN